jgi:hypothetical protein
MLNRKTYLLLALVPLCLTLLLRLFWQMLHLPFLAWLGVVSAIMGLGLPVVALVLTLQESEVKTSKSRLQALVLKSLLTGLSIVLCWNSYQAFSSISTQNPRTTKTVTIKNLSDQPIKDIVLNYGGQETKIKEIAGYGKEELKIQIIAETVLKASIKASDKTERSSQILIDSENSYVHILVDTQQNILAEVQ